MGVPAAIVIVSLFLKGIYLYVCRNAAIPAWRARWPPSRWRRSSLTWTVTKRRLKLPRWLATLHWWGTPRDNSQRSGRKMELTTSITSSTSPRFPSSYPGSFRSGMCLPCLKFTPNSTNLSYGWMTFARMILISYSPLLQPSCLLTPSSSHLPCRGTMQFPFSSLFSNTWSKIYTILDSYLSCPSL